jgi:hypothetical protein
MNKTIALICLTSLALFSCKKNSDTSSNSGNDFLEVTIDGQTLRNELPPGTSYCYENQAGCDSKVYVERVIDEFHKSTFEFNGFLKYYQNNVDFAPSQPGQYDVKKSSWDNPAICNLTFCFTYIVQGQPGSMTIQPGAVHKISSIKEYSSDNTRVNYTITGEFSCSVLSATNETHTITGKYRKTVPAYK